MRELALSKNRMKLLKLLGYIASGKIQSTKYPIDFLFDLYKNQRDNYARREYISPLDKSTYREIGEVTNTLTPY